MCRIRKQVRDTGDPEGPEKAPENMYSGKETAAVWKRS
jgi:hypothetical protein